ncbi:MAG: ribonuclease E inhibitor RraB [Glaciecola sp.]|jgi:regulator of ribonuclease activity B
MTNQDERQEWVDFTQECMTALLNDGSDPAAIYTIEHHMASQDFDMLEKAAVDAFKAGFEVGDAEEIPLDDGGIVFCFDAVIERKLDQSQLIEDLDTLIKICDKHKVHYDGWGTQFIEPTASI